MPFDGTNFDDGRPQPGPPPSGDTAGIMIIIVVSAALLLLPISLGSLVSIVLYLTGK
ncbi:MAG: hypothetical protein ACRYHQ_33265 [Janthinobacterium lividum]